MKTVIPILVLVFFFFETSIGQKYLAQKPPGLVPVKFAPGIVSLDDEHEFGSIFSSNGEEFYYAVDIERKAETRVMRLQNKRWSRPEKLLTSEKYSFNDPFLSPDERKLFFISDMALDGNGQKKDYDIWYIEKNGNNWSKPVNAGAAINSDKNEYYISFSKSGTMYFSSNAHTTESDRNNFDIYASKIKDGKFQEAVRLDNSVNTQHYEADVFIAYDESYLIFCGNRPDGYGKGDLYISFRNADGTWSKAKNMGKAINTEGHELCPFVTKDGKYFFYTSNRDIYWVDAGIINELR